MLTCVSNKNGWISFTLTEKTEGTMTVEAEAAGESLENVNANNGKIYNLNGQEMKNVQKGLYIVNGRKVVMKPNIRS